MGKKIILNDKETFINPCKQCLKRPVCAVKCDDLKNYIETLNVILFSSCWILTMIVCIIIIIAAYITFPTPLTASIIGTILLFLYGYAIKVIITEDYDEFQEFKRWQKIVIVLTAPFSIITAIWYHVLDFDEIADSFGNKYFSKGQT